MGFLLFFPVVLVVFLETSVQSVRHGHTQCRQYGYMGACSYHGVRAIRRDEICENLLCAAESSGSTYSYAGVGPAAVGTKCGPHHTCNILNKCVADVNRERPGYFSCGPPRA